MKKILLIAVIAVFAFAAKPKPSQTTSTSAESKYCGAILFFNNTTSASVDRVIVNWSNPAYQDVTYYYPTFPFNTGTRCCGGSVQIIIDFSSGSGVIRTVDGSNEFLACETFQAPYLSPFSFSTSCDDYYINIIDGTDCP
jgi:hypothetical protein